MGPAINESQLDTVLDYISIGKDEGAKLVAGGQRLTGKGHDKGWFVAPTVFGDGDRKMRIAREEIFGAVTVVVPVSSLEEAIDVANDSRTTASRRRSSRRTSTRPSSRCGTSRPASST